MRTTSIPTKIGSASVSLDLPVRLMSASIDDIPANDPLRELPCAVLTELATVYGFRAADELLLFPDKRILFAARLIHGVGRRDLSALRDWLLTHRKARGEPINEQMQAQAMADEALMQARRCIADAVVRRVAESGVSVDDLSKRCQSGAAQIATVLSGDSLPSLELAMRMAASLGIAVRVEVESA